MKANSLYVLILVLFSACHHNQPAKNIQIPILFSENMVFQQNQDIIIWGKADPYSVVKASFNQHESKAKTDKSGNWKLVFPPMNAGGPYELKVFGADTFTFKKVYIGEVWILAGTSDRISNIPALASPSEANANIHILWDNMYLSLEKQFDLKSPGWKVLAGDSVPVTSKMYVFAKKLYDSLQVPIGIINVGVPFSRIESWVESDSLKNYKGYKDLLLSMEHFSSNESTLTKEILGNKYEEKLLLWQSKIDSILHTEFGIDTQFIKTTNTDRLKLMKLPTVWEMAGLSDYDGLVWFFRHVKLPLSFKGHDITLKLGPIDDIDVTYVNNQWVGSTKQYNEKRIYVIPGYLTRGDLKLAIKVLDAGGGGGFYGKKSDMVIVNGDDSIPLAGDWNYIADFNYHNIPERPMMIHPQRVPSVVYNSMIHPLIPYGVKGIFFYQMDMNFPSSELYYSMLRTLINSYREIWQNNLSFIIVQIPFHTGIYTTGISEAQYKIGSMPGVDVVCSSDVDYFEKTRFDVVALRAANLALFKFYDRPAPYSGPRLREYTAIGNKIELIFETYGKSLISLNDQAVKGFEIASSNEQYAKAKAIINGNRVIIWNDTIKNPVAVRYGWADNHDANLYSSDTLPAFPFRTDNWSLKKKVADDEIENLKELFK